MGYTYSSHLWVSIERSYYNNNILYANANRPYLPYKSMRSQEILDDTSMVYVLMKYLLLDLSETIVGIIL